MPDTAISTGPATGRSAGDWLARNWLRAFLLIYGLWVILPFLAPIFMHLGWTGVGKAIYLIYSFFCHQLPERSFFFFGEKAMYSLADIQAAWQNTSSPLILRQFIGNETMGWKMAWSDRMISFYMGVWLVALLWYGFRRTTRPLKWWWFILLLLPMAADGLSHAISDVAGIGQGFRDTNLWLAALTNNALPIWFYAGDAIGSFNSLMRFITGLLAALAVAWLALPYLSRMTDLNHELRRLDHGHVLEQLKRKDPRSSG